MKNESEYKDMITPTKAKSMSTKAKSMSTKGALRGKRTKNKPKKGKKVLKSRSLLDSTSHYKNSKKGKKNS